MTIVVVITMPCDGGKPPLCGTAGCGSAACAGGACESAFWGAGFEQAAIVASATTSGTTTRYFIVFLIARALQFTRRVLPAQYGSRNSRRRNLPDGLRGRLCAQSIDLGTL